MRKLKLVLAPNASIEVSTEWIRDLRKGRLNGVYRLLDRLGIGLLLVFVALFPLLDAESRYGDSTYAYALLLVVLALIGVAIGLVVLTKWQRISDPPIFLPILTYAFLVLAAFLLVPASSANTFGQDGVRFLSGVLVMAFAALYYLVNIITNTEIRLDYLIKATMISLVLIVFSPLLLGDSTGLLYPAAVLSTPVFLLYLLKGRNVTIKLISFVAMLIAVWVSFQPDADIYTKIAVVLGVFIMILSWVASMGWQIKRPWASFVNDLRDYTDSKMTLFELLDSSAMFILTIFWLAWVVLTIVWALANQLDLIVEFGEITKDIRSAFEALEGGEIFVGTGMTGPLSGVSLANLIRFQGIVGVAAYILLVVSGFFIIMTRFYKKIVGENSLVLVYAPFLFGLPVLGIMSTITLPMVIIWWVMLAIIAKNLSMKQQAVKMLTSLEIRGRTIDKYLPYIQIALVVLLIVAWYFLAGSVQTLYNSGVI